jgi:8-oxo-dGTP diphosphatase
VINSSKVTKQITVIIGLVVHHSKILMVKRHEPEVPNAHLKWEFPGGKVEFGETTEGAVVREIKEETGVIVKAKRLLPCAYTAYWDYPWGTQQTLLFGYECEYVAEEKRKSDHHVKEVKWVLLSEFKNYESLPGGREFFDALRS